MPVPITRITARAYQIPTDRPEGDGTLAWDSTTLVLVHITAGGQTGLGYSYTSRAAAMVISDTFAPLLQNQNVFDIAACGLLMAKAVRNMGASGIAASAISAVDTALWDLKARLLGLSLVDLFGATQASVAVYGSGGFTTYDDKDIAAQIDAWRVQGITRVKIKIGAHLEQDLDRVKAARAALSDSDELFVDANGAYNVKQALVFAEQFQAYNVTWFEEPVSSDNLRGLQQIKLGGPAGMTIAAGEYIFTLFDAQRLLAADAVDTLQLDVTRCQGYSGFLQCAAVAAAHNVLLSSHCAPALHLPICCHLPTMQHMEYFYDHARIETLFFDGVPDVKHGSLTPDRTAPGHGLTLKTPDAERYAL